MKQDTNKALSERIAKLEREIRAQDSELQAFARTMVIVISTLASNNPDRLIFAERMRTIGDTAHMESMTSRRLVDAIADRIETVGTPPPEKA